LENSVTKWAYLPILLPKKSLKKSKNKIFLEGPEL